LLYREPIGKHFVQVCTTTPCMLRGSTEILNTVCEHLGGIKPGQTTKDGKFTVVEVECQGACSNAPMLVVGDDFYVSFIFYQFLHDFLKTIQEDLTPQTTKKILDAFKRGQKPKAGPQSGRQTSENSAGLTSLTSKVCSVLYEKKNNLKVNVLHIALRSW
jgi:NADH dehydrogenase (ubiquinone) flavoprotein 2